MAEPLPHIAICVATYRRPEGLAALVRSLAEQRFPGPAPRITLLVANNDAEDPEGRALSGALADLPFSHVLLHEPARGVVAARNRLLAALPADADFLAFLDDDERAAPGWLAAMLATQAATGADVVQGPVVPDYASPPPGWVTACGLFELGPYEDGQPMPSAWTNNVLVRAQLLRDTDARFDSRFNLSGGEDEEFFTRLRAGGAKIVASAGAVVHDSVPAQRMTLRWSLRRSFRKGNSLGWIARQHRRGRALRAVKGVGAMGKGAAITLTSGLVSAPARMRGLMETARGAGMLAAFAGLRFAEYGQAAVERERRHAA